MSRLSDSRNGVVQRGLRVPVSQVKNLRLIMPRKAAFALIFCFNASLLFAQEQATKRGSDRVKDTFERAMAQAASAAAVSHQVKEIFNRAARAVVKIHGVDEHSPICGTGFFIDPTGTLYTAYTVGGEAEDFTIEFNGKRYPARQLVKDLRSGIAMLKIDAAEKIRSDFVGVGEVRDGWIGVSQVLEAPQPAEGSRVEITQVVDGTPAANSGIKRGDVLLQLGQRKIAKPEDVINASFYVT